MTINFKAPDIKELKPRILVLGIGGAGGSHHGGIRAGLGRQSGEGKQREKVNFKGASAFNKCIEIEPKMHK